jgi:hypothetical protein
MQTSPWIVVSAVLALLLAALALRALLTHRARLPELPSEWALTPRPVFTTNERRVYRLLRDALPNHIVLAKLPLVRFCQPTDASKVRYWYDLLGTHHVGFAICSANGRVLAAIDLDNERGTPPRLMAIKEAVLLACRVRHLRCPVDRLPTTTELQLLVPQYSPSAQGAQPPVPPHLDAARDSLANTVATRRAQRSAKGQDATLFHDSFFAMDSRLDGMGSDFGGLSSGGANGHAAAALDDEQTGTPLGAVVVPSAGGAPTRH